MRRVEPDQIDDILPFFTAAAELAKQASCYRRLCGSIVVADGAIIGEGFNGPPLNAECNRTCHEELDHSVRPKYDKTCCMHAEWRAIIDGAHRGGELLRGATLYFMRVDRQGNFTSAPTPYCTVCSRITLDAGIAEFALWNEGGADIYTTEEYNRLSYQYHALTH